MPRLLLIVLALGAVCLGCERERRAASPPTAPPAASTAPPADPQRRPTQLRSSPAPTEPTARAAGPTATPSACGYGPATRLAELQERGVKEASALVASRRSPGVYWTLNDSGNDASLFAFDQSGRNLARFRVENAENVDWEALQAGPGRDGGFALYVGDTGDNTRTRRESVIYRVPEPEVSLNAEKPIVGKTAAAEPFRFTIPGGSQDVETLLVHPTTGEVLLISKEYSGRGAVYRLPTPLDAGRRVSLEAVGELDLAGLGVLAGAATDGAVSPDGRRVVIRTYVAAVEYDVPPGATLASIRTQQPRAYPLNDGPQGEGITYRVDGKALLTIGEGLPAVLYQLEWRC